MKKLALNLDELSVDSFDTSSSEPEARGTVKGQQGSYYGTCAASCYTCQFSCAGGSCWNSCDGSCYGTCQYTCVTCEYSCNGTCGQGTCYGNTCICPPQ